MPTYHLYKDGNIINVIYAGLGFVESLKNSGKIDDFKDEAQMENPVALKRNEKGFFVPHLPRPNPVMPDLPKQITIEEVMEKVEKLAEKLEATEKHVTAQTQDVNAAILAIRGFMMEIPNIQKSLLDLQDMVKPK